MVALTSINDIIASDIMFRVKIFQGSHASTKIFYLEFFINEIFSVEKFPNYDIKFCLYRISQNFDGY